MCENADKYRGFQIFETLLVVLNVDGSSPSGHPKKKSCNPKDCRTFTFPEHEIQSRRLPFFG